MRNEGCGKIWRSSNHNGGGLKKMQSCSHGNLELKNLVATCTLNLRWYLDHFSMLFLAMLSSGNQ